MNDFVLSNSSRLATNNIAWDPDYIPTRYFDANCGIKLTYINHVEQDNANSDCISVALEQLIWSAFSLHVNPKVTYGSTYLKDFVGHQISSHVTETRGNNDHEMEQYPPDGIQDLLGIFNSFTIVKITEWKFILPFCERFLFTISKVLIVVYSLVGITVWRFLCTATFLTFDVDRSTAIEHIKTVGYFFSFNLPKKQL